MQKRAMFLLTLLLPILACISACGGKGAGQEAAGQMPPTLVEAATARKQAWQEQVQATGTLTAEQGVILKPEISGHITQIFFKSGDVVQQGAPLLEIDPYMLKADRDYAKAQFILSEDNHKRAQELFRRKVLSRSDLDTTLANYNSSKANLDKAQAALDQALIKAPFTGRLGLAQVKLGDYVEQGQTLVNLQANDNLRVDFNVPEIYLGKLALEQTVIITSDALPQKLFEGKISAIDSAVNESTRTLPVRAYIPNKEQKLFPGMFVHVTLLLGAKTDVIVIPQVAVTYSEDGNYVYKIVKQKAVKTPVQIGERLRYDIAILDGLAAGDVVVSAGAIKLYDGASVMVKSDANALAKAR